MKITRQVYVLFHERRQRILENPIVDRQVLSQVKILSVNTYLTNQIAFL